MKCIWVLQQTEKEIIPIKGDLHPVGIPLNVTSNSMCGEGGQHGAIRQHAEACSVPADE